jgi:hypothetical protein
VATSLITIAKGDPMPSVRALLMVLAVLASALVSGCATVEERAAVSVVIGSDDQALASRIALGMRAKGYQRVFVTNNPFPQLLIVAGFAPAWAVVDAQIVASAIMDVTSSSFRVEYGTNRRYTNIVLVSAPTQDYRVRAIMRAEGAKTVEEMLAKPMLPALPAAKPPSRSAAPAKAKAKPRPAAKPKPKPKLAAKPKPKPKPAAPSPRASKTGTFENNPPGPPAD